MSGAESEIVITGMGAVTPVGIGVENYWKNIVAGQCGIREIERIETAGLPVTVAAEVPGFHAEDYLPHRLCTDMDVFMQYAYVAAGEALKNSGLDAANSRTAIVMGTALAGIGLTCATQRDSDLGKAHVGPRFLTQVMGNMAAAQFAIAHGITGPNMTVSTACSSGGDAMILAAMLLKENMVDAVVVMAGEASLSASVIESLWRTNALSKAGESKPFDFQRDGFVIGEGGGAVILEKESHAKVRGAKIEASLLGYANNNDAHHVVSPNPEGIGAGDCMRTALERAGLSPADIQYLNAHGTATRAGDSAETNAILSVFGKDQPLVSSTKGATGHMMGAGGITEVITCIKAIQTGCLPPTLHHTKQDVEGALRLVANEAGHASVTAAMSNAFGFGGQNSCIIVGSYHG